MLRALENSILGNFYEGGQGACPSENFEIYRWNSENSSQNLASVSKSNDRNIGPKSSNAVTPDSRYIPVHSKNLEQANHQTNPSLSVK